VLTPNKKKSSDQVQQLSKELKLLLDFVNLGKEPGKLSPTPEYFDKSKRTPDPKKVDFSKLIFYPPIHRWGRSIFRLKKILSQFQKKISPEVALWKEKIEKELKASLNRRCFYTIDPEGNTWLKEIDKLPKFSWNIDRFIDELDKKLQIAKPKWAGMLDGLPPEKFQALLQDFKKRNGLIAWSTPIFYHEEDELKNFKEQVESVGIEWLNELWHEMRNAFKIIALGYGADDFFNQYFNPEEDEPREPRIMSRQGGKRIEFEAEPYNLYKGILAYFGDFYLNQFVLHPRLKLCLCCGSFFFKEKKPGRPQKFCDPKCEDVFNQLSKEEKAKLEKGYRAFKKKAKEFKKLVQLLIDDGKSEEEAKKIAEDWIYQQSKTLKQYEEAISVEA